MSDQYIGEIRMFSGDYAPQGWAMCNGQLLNIRNYEALYTLLGTTYGGDGISTFRLPDLRGRLPIHCGAGYALGASGGTETVTLTTSQLPVHTHAVIASAENGTRSDPGNAHWAASALNQYVTAAGNGVMDPGTVSSVGGYQPHDNVMPYTALTFIIALQGSFPPAS